jgi:putative transposase
MADKYLNKYRIESTRLQNWDYGWNAAYFVTICTGNMAWYFGDVINKKMNFSEIGEVADKCWLEIPEHFSFVKLDVHQVMPNHVHGIIIIDKPNGRPNYGCVGGELLDTQNFAYLPIQPIQPSQTQKNKFGPQSQNLASIIRGYKIGVTKYARNNGISFSWQSRFHDHIIRDDASFKRIQQYIINNPQNWDSDKFYKNTKK